MDDGMISLVHAHTPGPQAFVNRHTSSIIKAAAWSYSFVVLLAAAGAGVLLFDKRHFFVLVYPAMSLFFILFAYWCLVHRCLAGFRKYRWFMDLLFFFPASFFLVWLWNRKKNR